MSASRREGLANHEIVTIAVYLLGGDARRIDTEDVAKKANDLAPGRFTWRKYQDQINIDTVRKRLWDATRPDKGGFLKGTERLGWILTTAGLQFAKDHEKFSALPEPARQHMGLTERNRLTRERERMLASEAYQRYAAGSAESITLQEAQSFFRIDAYVTGSARSQKLARAKNLFGTDPDLGPLINFLLSKISDEENSK